MSDELPDLAPLYARHDADTAASRDRRGSRPDRTITWELLAAEKAHYLAQDPVEYDVEHRPPMGIIVMDRDGDAWEFGRTRWTLLSNRSNKHLRRPGFTPPSEYAPYREIGKRGRGARPTIWCYRLFRPVGVY